MYEQLKDRFPEKRIEVIPNGVDTAIFWASEEILEVDRYILFVGRLVEQKGVDHLLRAFVHVQKRFPELRLLIVGDGPCKTTYENLATSMLISEKVTFDGWKRSGAELSEIYRGASVVIVPSIYEPFGMTALEAMACGRPVVASKTGGLKEIIQHGVTGYLAEPGDHLDLAQWIIRLLARRELQQELGKNAARFIHESTHYKWPAIASKYVGFYQELIRDGPKLELPTEAREYKYQIEALAKFFEKDSSLVGKVCGDLFRWIQ
jgi:glycosyltransferase involved in cell wall biosynthesis